MLLVYIWNNYILNSLAKATSKRTDLKFQESIVIETIKKKENESFSSEAEQFSHGFHFQKIYRSSELSIYLLLPFQPTS